MSFSPSTSRVCIAVAAGACCFCVSACARLITHSLGLANCQYALFIDGHNHICDFTDDLGSRKFAVHHVDRIRSTASFTLPQTSACCNHAGFQEPPSMRKSVVARAVVENTRHQMADVIHGWLAVRTARHRANGFVKRALKLLACTVHRLAIARQSDETSGFCDLVLCETPSFRSRTRSKSAPRLLIDRSCARTSASQHPSPNLLFRSLALDSPIRRAGRP